LIINPLALSFNSPDPAQAVERQSAYINNAKGITAFSVSTSEKWLSATPRYGVAPSHLSVTVTPAGLAPGIYTGAVILAPTDDIASAVRIPVVLSVSQPNIAAVVNAASFAQGAVAPGEFVTIFGSHLGPAAVDLMAFGGDGRISTLVGGTQVIFDGIPAPIVYASAGQVSAIVPVELAGREITTVHVEHGSASSNSASLLVVGANPGVFTLNDSLQGAILNQDGTVNSQTNPAVSGSLVSLYATGCGLTTPAYVDGQIMGTGASSTILPVHLGTAGQTMHSSYAGSAPGMPGGLLQINTQLPTDVHGRIPILLTVGPRTSPTVYMWVR